MKNPKLGDYFLWKGKLAKVIGAIPADRHAISIEMVEPSTCPHCNGDLGKEQFTMIPASPLFQESAETIQAMEDDPRLTLS